MSRIFSGGALLLLAGCGDSPEASTSPRLIRTPEKAERLASAARDFEARLALPHDSERLDATLAEVARLLDGTPEGEELDFGESTLLQAELKAYQRWNLPVHTGEVAGSLLDFESEDNPIHMVTDYARILEEHGIDLLVVPIPTRLDIYPERLPAIDRESSYRGGNRGMLQFFLELNRHGVEVVDLYALFEQNRYDADAEDDGDLYFHREYHWTPRAVELASDLLARRVAELQGVPFTPQDPQLVIAHETGPWDLLSKSGSETIELRFRSVELADGSRAFKKDRENETLVLGDSFMVQFREHNADLASHLYADLGRPFDMIAMSGGGARKVWSSVARRRDKLTGKQLVVWQFTSRALTSRVWKPVEIFEN